MVALPSLPGLAGAGGGSLGGLSFMGAGLIGQGVAAYGQYEAQQGISQSSQNIAQLQQQANQVSWNQARLGFERNRLQEFRNAQQARSSAISSAVGAGAQFSSGLQGGLANISGESGSNILSLNQNEKLAGQQYNINKGISGQEMDIAKYQGTAAMWAGLGSLAGGASSAGKSIVDTSTNPSGGLQFS